ncbi:MAG: patatin-like phospholipase family protein [Spirulina sp.]
MSDRTYKILSLDGGGFRGVMSARILQALEEKLGNKSLQEYFDLVTGTSTGSILAAGIALGKTAKELLHLYETRGKDIFPDRIRNRRKLLNITRGIFPIALYPHGEPNMKKQGLASVLAEELGNQKIYELEKPILVIPAYDTWNRKTWWFASNNSDSQRQWYDGIPVWKLCVCSASAPTYFPPYNLEIPKDEKVKKPLKEGQKVREASTGLDKLPFIDGGVAVNNPALVGIAHALLLPTDKDSEGKSQWKNPEQWQDITIRKMSILSIGTGETTQKFTYEQVKSWGMVKWATRLGDLFIPAPNEITESVCWQIIRRQNPDNAKRVLRLDFAIDTNKEEDKDLETIDDYRLYDRFVKVADNYLNNGTVRVGDNDFITPSEAIARFIDNNP